jgi:hypothetical protein
VVVPSSNLVKRGRVELKPSCLTKPIITPILKLGLQCHGRGRTLKQLGQTGQSKVAVMTSLPRHWPKGTLVQGEWSPSARGEEMDRNCVQRAIKRGNTG